MRIKYRILLLLVASISLLLLLFGIAIYYFQSNYSYTDFYKRLEARVSIAKKSHFGQDRISAKSLQKLRDEHLERLTNEKEYVFAIRKNADPAAIAREKALPLPFLTEITQQGKARYQVDNLFYAGTTYKHNNSTFLVIVSAKNYYVSHHLRTLRNVLIAGVLISILIITYVSLYFSKQVFDPIKSIIREVNNISAGNIHLRLEEKENDKEIGQMVATFNNLLNRIETAFETHKNFISNASHEIGTPLTSIIGEADVALSKERSVDEYKDALQRILEQAERLNKVSQSLLFLAQTGYKENRLSFEIVRTDELVLQAKEIMDQLIPENTIQIDFSLLPENPKKLKINGNKEILLLSLTNILTNACKYSRNKPVDIRLASTSNEVILVINDSGIGIPAAEMPYIYDPFFRASNTTSFEGYGIGLPLTRNIIRIHNGTLNVSSIENEGVTVELRFPMAVL
jgi:signal transduction histidine kinase